MYSGLQPVARSDYDNMLITPYTGGCNKSMNYYDKDKPEDELEIIVAKASHGRTGTIKVGIDLKHMNVYDIDERGF